MDVQRLAAVLPTLLLITGGCGKISRSSKFLIPSGYIGWIQVQYGVRGAPPLPVENGFYLIRVPPNGRVKTSTKQDFGWRRDEFYYNSGNRRERLRISQISGDGGRVWGEQVGNSWDNDTSTTDRICFIGTEVQYKELAGKVTAWDIHKGKMK